MSLLAKSTYEKLTSYISKIIPNITSVTRRLPLKDHNDFFYMDGYNSIYPKLIGIYTYTPTDSISNDGSKHNSKTKHLAKSKRKSKTKRLTKLI